MGYFDDEETAATKFDEHAAPLGRAVNFPSEGHAQATMGKSSKFRGVHWHKSHQKWTRLRHGRGQLGGGAGRGLTAP